MVSNVVQGSAATLITVSTCVQYSSSSASNPVANCATYGPMVPGSSSLSVGCVTCNQNYMNVGGYCVANLTQTNATQPMFVCNINNCVYCIQNNVCGQCATGYTAYMGSSYQCTKNYSPIPNCLLTPLFAPICVACAQGYVLVDSVACVSPPSTSVTCNLTGCNYCITNNTCFACLTGYTLADGACTALCTIANCVTCASNIQCQACALGFYVSNGNCVNSSSQAASYCTQTFGTNCATCSYYQCQSCATGMSLNPNTGACCTSPTYNYANCATYSTSWASTGCTVTVQCTQCNIGSFLMYPYVGAEPQCSNLPCNITNCAYCFQSTVCVVCSAGYNLQNNTCTQYTAPTCNLANCITCNSNNQCTQCLNGYLLYNGACVCNFQNCLTCQGSAFCTQCAWPTIATIFQPGCIA